jgi:hypothetical protein
LINIHDRRSMARVRATAAVSIGVLALSLCGLTAGPVQAARGPCTVTNVTAGGASSSDLQAEIDAADPGDTLTVVGVCDGPFAISKTLTMQAGSTSPWQSTLNGDDRNPVLRTSGAGSVITLIGMRISDGRARNGAGIRNRHADLVLIGTKVVWNSAEEEGGGIATRYGSLQLRADSRVANNAALWGGGIDADSAPVTLGGQVVLAENYGSNSGGGLTTNARVIMGGSSRVVRNSSGAGGGFYLTSSGALRVEGSATIRDNRSPLGGGIANYGSVRLRQSAKVTSNLAKRGAGGIYNFVSANLSVGGQARIVNNRARRDGGGVWNQGNLQMSGRSVVARNQAWRGGGVFNETNQSQPVTNVVARAVLRDSSRVARNAAIIGGGILNRKGIVKVRGDAAVVNNIPDDCVRCAL